MDTNSIVYRVRLDSKDMKGSLYELKDAYKELEKVKKELENRNVGTNDADYRLIKSQMKDVQALLGLYYKGWKDIQEVVSKAFILPTNALEATLRDIEKRMKELSSTPEGMEELAELQAQQAVLVDTIRKRNLDIRNIEQDRLNLSKLSNAQLAESLKSAKAILAVETRDTEESKKRHQMAMKHAMDIKNIQDKQAGKQNLDEATSTLALKSADLTIGRIKEAGDTVSRYQKQLGEFFDEATGQRFAHHLDDAQRLLRERAAEIAKGSVQATYEEMSQAIPIIRKMRSEELEGSDKAQLYDGWINALQSRAKHGAEVIADSANIMAEAGQLLSQSINNSVSAEKEALSVQQAQTKEQEEKVKLILAEEKAQERIGRLAKEQASKQRATTKQKNIDLQAAQQEADAALAEDTRYKGTRTRVANLTAQREAAQQAKTDAEFNILGLNRDIERTQASLRQTSEERRVSEQQLLALQATTVEGRAHISDMLSEEQTKLDVINSEQQRAIELLRQKRQEEQAYQQQLAEIENRRNRLNSEMLSTQSLMDQMRKAKPESRTATSSSVDVMSMLGEGGFVQKTWLPDIQKAGERLDRIEAKFKSEGKQIPEQIGVWRGILDRVYAELTDQERGLPARLRQSGGVMAKEVFDHYFKSVNDLLAQVNSDIQVAASGDGSMFGRYNTIDGLFTAVDKSTYNKQSLRGRRTRNTALTQEIIEDSIDPTFLMGQFEQAQKLTLSNLFRTFDPQKELINSLANGGKFDTFVERLRDKIQAAFDAKESGGFGKGVFDDYIGSLQQIYDFVKKIQNAGGTDLFASARVQIKQQIAENQSAIETTGDQVIIERRLEQNKQLRSMLDELDRVEGKGQWSIDTKKAALQNMEQQIKSNREQLEALGREQEQVEANHAVQVSIDNASGTDFSSIEKRIERMTEQSAPIASQVEYLQRILNGNSISDNLSKANADIKNITDQLNATDDKEKQDRLSSALEQAKQEKAFWESLVPVIKSRYEVESAAIDKLTKEKSAAAERERKAAEELQQLRTGVTEEDYQKAKAAEEQYKRNGKRQLTLLENEKREVETTLATVQVRIDAQLKVLEEARKLTEDEKKHTKDNGEIADPALRKAYEARVAAAEEAFRNATDADYATKRNLEARLESQGNIKLGTDDAKVQIEAIKRQIVETSETLRQAEEEGIDQVIDESQRRLASLQQALDDLQSGKSLSTSDKSKGASGILEQIKQITTTHTANLKIIEQWEKKDTLILEKEQAIAKAKQQQADAEKEIAARMNFQTAAEQGSSQWVREVTAYMETLDKDSALYTNLNKSITDYNNAVAIQQTLIAAATKEHDDLQAKETEQEKHLKELNGKLKEYNDIITNSDQVMADRQKALDRLNEKMELAKAAQDRLTAANKRLAEVNAVDPRAVAMEWAEQERAKALAEVKSAQDAVTAATKATTAAQEEYNRKLTEGGGVSINKLKESFDKLRDLYLNEGDANKTAEIKALMDRVQARIHQLEVTPALAFNETLAEVRSVLDRQAADQAAIDAAHQESLDRQEQSNTRLAEMKDVMLANEREMLHLRELEEQQNQKDEQWQRRRQSRVEKLASAQQAYDIAHNDEQIAAATQARGEQLQIMEQQKANYVRGQQMLQSAKQWQAISDAIGATHGTLATAQSNLASAEDELIKSAYSLGDQFHVVNGEVRTMSAQHLDDRIKRINDRLGELDAPVKLRYNKNSKSENYGRMEKVELEDPSALYSDAISARAQRENESARAIIQREVRRNMSRERSIGLAQVASLEAQMLQAAIADMEHEVEDILTRRLQTDLQNALQGGGQRNGAYRDNVERLIRTVGLDGKGGDLQRKRDELASIVKKEVDYLEKQLASQRQHLAEAEALSDDEILTRLTERPEASLKASEKQRTKWQKRLAKEDITDEERTKAQQNLDKVERRIERIQQKLETIKADPRQYWNDTVIEGYKSRIESWDTQLQYLMDGKYEQAYAAKVERLMRQQERSNKTIAEQAEILHKNRSAYQKSQDDIIRYSDDLDALQHKQITHLATYAANGGGEDADKRIKAQMDRFRAMYEDATTGKHTEDERYRNALYTEFADDKKREQISKNVFSGIVSSGSKSVLNDLQMMYQTLFKTTDKAGQQFLADSMHGVQDVMTEMRRRLQQNDIAYRETDQIRDDATRTERRKELYKEYLAIIKESNAQLEQYRSSVRFVYEAWKQSDTTARATVQTEDQQRESLYKLIKETKEHGEVLELDEKQTKSYNSMVSRSTERLQENYDKRNKLLMQDIDRQQELARIDALLAVTVDEQQRKNLEKRKLEYNATSRAGVTNSTDIAAANTAVSKSATSLGNLGDDARLRADIAAQTKWKEDIQKEINKTNDALAKAQQRLTEVKPEEANKRMQIEANVAGLTARLELLGKASQQADAAISAFQEQLGNTQPVVKLWEKSAEQLAQEQQEAFSAAYRKYLWTMKSVSDGEAYGVSDANKRRRQEAQEAQRLATVKAGEGLDPETRRLLQREVALSMQTHNLTQNSGIAKEISELALEFQKDGITDAQRKALETKRDKLAGQLNAVRAFGTVLEQLNEELKNPIPEEKELTKNINEYKASIKATMDATKARQAASVWDADRKGNAYTAEQKQQNEANAQQNLEAMMDAMATASAKLPKEQMAKIYLDTVSGYLSSWKGQLDRVEQQLSTETDVKQRAILENRAKVWRETLGKLEEYKQQAEALVQQYPQTVDTPVSGGDSSETPIEKAVKRQTRTILKDNKELQTALVEREKAWLSSQDKVRGGAYYSNLRDAGLLNAEEQKRYDYYHLQEYTDKQGNKSKGSIQEYATFKTVADAKAENLAHQLEDKDAAAYKRVQEAALIESIDYLDGQWKSALAKADRQNNALAANPDDPRLKAAVERYTNLANDIQTRIGTLKNELGVLQAQMKAEGIASQVTNDKASGKEQTGVEDTAARKNARERAARSLERDERNISNKEMELENAKNIRRWGYYTQERAALETALQAQIVGFTDKDGKHIDSEVERIAKSYGMEVESIKTVKSALAELDKAYAEHHKMTEAQAALDAKQSALDTLDDKLKDADKRYKKAETDTDRTAIESERQKIREKIDVAESELKTQREEYDKVVDGLTAKTVESASEVVEAAEQKVIAAAISALEEQMTNADIHLNELEQRAKTAAERYDKYMLSDQDKADIELMHSKKPADRAKVSQERSQELQEHKVELYWMQSLNPADKDKVSPERKQALEEQMALLQKIKDDTRQAADAERERQQQERTGLMEGVAHYRSLQKEVISLEAEKNEAARKADEEKKAANELIAGYVAAEKAASEWESKLAEYHEAAKNRTKTETALTKAQRELENFDAAHPREVVISEAELAARKKQLEDNLALAKQNYEAADNAARQAREAELAIRQQGNVSKAELKEQLAYMQQMLETGHLDEEQRNTLNKTIAETEQRIKRLSNIMFSEQETLDIFAGAEDALQRYNKGMDITVGEMKALHEQTMQVANDETQTIQRREQALAIAKQMQNALNGKGAPSADGINLKQFDDEQVERLFTSATETLRRYNEGQEVTVLEMKNMHEQIGNLVKDDYQLMDTHKKAIAIQKQYADALNKSNVSKDAPADGVSLKQFESYQVDKMFTAADGVLQRYREGMEVTVLEIQNMRDQMQALANDEYQTIQTHQQAIDITRQLTDALNARKIAEKPSKSMNQIRSIINKGEKATVDEINEAIKSLKILKENGSITAHEFQKLEDKIKKLEQTLRGDKVKYSENFVKHIIDSIDTAPIEDLQKALQQVEERIKKAERGQVEYVTLTEEYKKLKSQIDKHNESLGKTKDSIRETNNELAKQSDWFTTNMKKLANYLGIFGGFRLVTQEFRKFFQESMKYDDQLTNIKKTTDLTDSSIRLLADGLKHIQTRSSIEQLNNLAYAAGKLGVKSVSDVMGFVRAADMLNVSLGEQLGNDAAEKLMKIANIRGTTQQYDLEEALERTGSAITYLAKNSAASGDAIVAFMSRTAGLSKQAGITTAELSGLAAAVSALNQPVEMSATSFSKMMVQMEKSYKTVGKTLKMTDQETERMRLQMETGHAMDAFLDMLRRVKEMGGLSETAKMAKDLGSEGNRVIQTLTTLSSSYETIKRMVDDSSDAFERNTTVLQEYHQKNQNVAALWERLQNNMHRMFISPEANDALREILIKLQVIPDAIKQLVSNFSGLASFLANTVTNHVYGLVNAISALIKVMFFRSIITNVINWFGQLSASVAAMSATLHKTSPAFRLYRMEMAAATTATARFNAGVKLLSATLKFTNIVGIIFTIVGALWSLYEVFFNNEKEATKWADEISEATNRAAVAADAETQELEKKLSVLHDENVAETEKLRIRQSLQDTYGAYLGNIKAETADLNELEKACRAANEQLKAKQILQATDARIKEISDNALNEQSSDYAGLVKLVLQRLPEGKQDQATAMKIVNELMEDWSKYLEVDKDGKFDTNKAYSMATKFVGLSDTERRMQANLNQLLLQYGAKPLNMNSASVQIQGDDINWDDAFQDYAVSLANKQRETGMDAEAMQNYGYSQAKLALEKAMPEIKNSMDSFYQLFEKTFTRGGKFGATQVRTQDDENQWAYMKRDKTTYGDKQRNEDIANANKYLTVARDYLVDLRSLAVVELDLLKKQKLNNEANALEAKISNVDKFQEIMGLGIVDQETSDKQNREANRKGQDAYKNIIAKVEEFYKHQAEQIEDDFHAGKMTRFAFDEAIKDNERELNYSLASVREAIGNESEEYNKLWMKRIEFMEKEVAKSGNADAADALRRIIETSTSGKGVRDIRRLLTMGNDGDTSIISEILKNAADNTRKGDKINVDRKRAYMDAWLEQNPLGKLSNQYQQQFEQLHLMLADFQNYNIDVIQIMNEETGLMEDWAYDNGVLLRDVEQQAMDAYRAIGENAYMIDITRPATESVESGVEEFRKYIQQFPVLAEKAKGATTEQLMSIYYMSYEYAEQYAETLQKMAEKTMKLWTKMYNSSEGHKAYEQKMAELKELKKNLGELQRFGSTEHFSLFVELQIQESNYNEALAALQDKANRAFADKKAADALSENTKEEAEYKRNRQDQAQKEIDQLEVEGQKVLDIYSALLEAQMSLRENTWGWLADLGKTTDKFAEAFVPLRSWYEQKGSWSKNIFGTKEERQKAFGEFMDDLKKQTRAIMMEQAKMWMMKWMNIPEHTSKRTQEAMQEGKDAVNSIIKKPGNKSDEKDGNKPDSTLRNDPQYTDVDALTQNMTDRLAVITDNHLKEEEEERRHRQEMDAINGIQRDENGEELNPDDAAAGKEQPKPFAQEQILEMKQQAFSEELSLEEGLNQMKLQMKAKAEQEFLNITKKGINHIFKVKQKDAKDQKKLDADVADHAVEVSAESNEEVLATEQATNAAEILLSNTKADIQKTNSEETKDKEIADNTTSSTVSMWGSFGEAIAKAWAQGGPYLGPILAGIVSAALGAVMTMVFNMMGGGKKATAPKTKLVSGMLTYDRGNVQSFRGVSTYDGGGARPKSINMLPVVGDDGRVYMVPEGDLMGGNGMSGYTGMVNRPTLTNVGGQPALVGERGPEMVIGRETTAAMMMSRPDLIRQIMEFDRNRSRGFAKTFDAGTLPPATVPDASPSGQEASQQELLAMLDANAAMMAQMAQVIDRLSAQVEKGIGVRREGDDGVVNAVAKGMADARRTGNNKYVTRLFGK